MEAEVSQGKEAIESFHGYIDKGGELIKESKFDEAILHFHNKDVLSQVGLRLEASPRYFGIGGVRPEEYPFIIDSVAKNSWYHEKSSYSPQTIELAGLSHVVKNKDGVFEKKPIPKELQRELALISMEEWLHGLQDIGGQPLAGEKDQEIDVALYMLQQGIQLTQAFLGRHDRVRQLTKHNPSSGQSIPPVS